MRISDYLALLFTFGDDTSLFGASHGVCLTGVCRRQQTRMYDGDQLIFSFLSKLSRTLLLVENWFSPKRRSWPIPVAIQCRQPPSSFILFFLFWKRRKFSVSKKEKKVLFSVQFKTRTFPCEPPFLYREKWFPR